MSSLFAYMDIPYNIEVVNVSHEACTHFCGRPEWYGNRAAIDASTLGNRTYAFETYEEYFDEYLKDTRTFRALVEYVRHCKEAKLGCFCKEPSRCHCSIIKRKILKELL